LYSKRTTSTVVWTADGASGNFVAGNNAVNHPTYKALPGQTGAMAPALNNGEDVSGRLSFSRGSNGAIAPAPAPALSHIPDMSHRMAYHDMNNDAGPAWNAGTFSALQPVYPQFSNMYAAVQPPNMLNFGGQVPIMGTGAEAPATFGTGMLDGFGFDNHLSSYWVQQNWTQ
jgi:hypothetical protein